MNFRFILFPLILVLLHGTAFSASTAEAEKRLKKAVAEVLATATSASSDAGLAEDLRPVLQKYISFSAMTRRAIGPGWRQFTSQEKNEATRLFTILVIRSYSRKLNPGEQPVIKFKTAVEPAPGRVEVPTALLYKGSDYDVTYRMEKAEGWRITDVVIEGVSLVANYRVQFDSQFKKGGAQAVINSLSQSVASPK